MKNEEITIEIPKFGSNEFIKMCEVIFGGDKKMSDNKQTAVEWFFDQIRENSLIKPSLENGFEIIYNQAKELEKQGFHLERRLLTVDGSIKSLGTYEVKAKLFNDVTATFKLKVAIDAAMAEELKKQQAEAQKRNAEKKAKAEAAKAAAAAEAEAAANAE